MALAPVLVAGLMGAAEAKPVKGELCPTKVSGRIERCKEGRRCTLDLKKGDVLTDIQYFGSEGCDKKTGFTKIKVADVDQKGVVFNVKGTLLPGIKGRFRVDYAAKNLSKRMKALGISAGKTKNPKVARLILRN